MKKLSLPKLYRMPFLAIIACIALAFLYGWQEEICVRNVADDRFLFEFPFFLGGSMSVWWARDFWYTVLACGVILGLFGAYELGCRVAMVRFIKKFAESVGYDGKSLNLEVEDE